MTGTQCQSAVAGWEALAGVMNTHVSKANRAGIRITQNGAPNARQQQ